MVDDIEVTPQVAAQAQGSVRIPWWASRQWLLSQHGEMMLLASSEDGPDVPRMGRRCQQEPETLALGTYEGGIASLSIQGVLMSSAPWFFEGDTDYDIAAKLVRTADADPEIRALILEVDSPGGEATGVSTLADAVRDCQIPVVVQVGALCCSAAYWVASQADWIVAGPTTQVGSIGTIRRSLSVDALLKKIGLDVLTQRSEQSPDKALNPADSKRGATLSQGALNAYTSMFHRYVAAGRGVSPEHVADHYGKGSTFNGEEALPLGLIDAIGQLPDAITKARQLADERAQMPATNNTPALSRTEESMSSNTDSTPAVAGTDTANNLSAMLQAANSRAEKAENALAALQGEHQDLAAKQSALTTERDSLAAEVEKFKAQALSAQKAQALDPLKANGKIAGSMVMIAERAWDKTHCAGDADAWPDFLAMIDAREPMVDTAIHTTSRAPGDETPEQADDRRIRDYCKQNSMDANNPADYASAHRALGLN